MIISKIKPYKVNTFLKVNSILDHLEYCSSILARNIL